MWRMLLHKKELKRKKLLSLVRRSNELWDQRRKISPIRLDKPIFNGYVCELVLREEVLRRNDGARIQELIKWLGQDKAFCRDKSFVRHVGRKKTTIQPCLRSAPDPRFASYSTEKRRLEAAQNIEKFQKYLEHHGVFGCFCENFQFKMPHYVFRFPWMLEHKISEHYLTHYFPVDGDIEGELHRIRDVLHVYDGILYGNRCKEDRDERIRARHDKLLFSEQDVDSADFVL